MPAKKILFIGNDAGRTGAPMVLLWLMQQMATNPNFELDLLLLNGGSMLAEFEKYTNKTWVWNFDEPNYESIAKRGAKKILNKIKTPQHQKSIIKQITKAKYGLIYINTTAIGELFAVINKNLTSTPKLIHVHELDFIMQHHCGAAWAQHALMANRYIAVSPPVANILTQKYNIPAQKIATINPFIANGFAQKQQPEKTQHIAEQLGLQPNDFVVGMVGVGGWRKGTDLLIPLLADVAKTITTQRTVHFIWLGFDPGSEILATINYDVQKLQLPVKVHLLNKVTDPYNYYPLMNLQLLLAREDPFPLVILEGGAFGVPFICFEQSGGMPTLANRGTGFTVPYLNTKAMAKLINQLANSPQQLQQKGQQLKQIVATELTSSTGTQKIINEINNLTQ